MPYLRCYDRDGEYYLAVPKPVTHEMIEDFIYANFLFWLAKEGDKSKIKSDWLDPNLLRLKAMEIVDKHYGACYL